MGEDQALAQLRSILGRPEYQIDQARPWWDQLLGPAFDLLGYLVARVVKMLADATSGREGAFGISVFGVCLALFAVVGVYLIRTIRLSVLRQDEVAHASLGERRERSERLWQTAQQLAAGGQRSEAVRVLYLSALYALDERAALRVDSSLTNREHARLLSQSHPDLRRTFNEVVERYDCVRYGGVQITETTFTELSGLVARARAASLRGSTA